MSEQVYFEQFKGEGDPYYETEWYDEWAILYGTYANWCHGVYIDKNEADKELARLQSKYPDENITIDHHHYDSPQRWNLHDGGWFPMRSLD